MEKVLYRILMEVNPEIMENKETDLIEEGIITSLDLINIVAEIEEELQVEIEPEDIVADNFISYAAIEKLFLKYLSA